MLSGFRLNNELVFCLVSGAAWVGRAPCARSASSIPDVKMGHVSDRGSVTAWKAGEACFVTKVSTFYEKNTSVFYKYV